MSDLEKTIEQMAIDREQQRLDWQAAYEQRLRAVETRRVEVLAEAVGKLVSIQEELVKLAGSLAQSWELGAAVVYTIRVPEAKAPEPPAT